ncbi:PREDICTED: protein EIN4-like isoform X2 [Nelumbo nucifera]|uniref:Ethylene receptor n=1 Tax=Nelumbo nucifera TaxID=4432 RepID=A0A1U8AAK1_NELNU|nr:PREDICTED: protein EIN4-like isoform X2 [Nelumbo nucifera]
MLKASASLLSIFSLFFSVSAMENGFPRCNCDDEGFWSVDNILECQRVSDFLIAVAYFSIPVELLYFVSCSNVPFKWVLFQFIAFIVLCGMTHLLNGWTYAPHTFQLMLVLTIFKFLTALVSSATAITLITLIPLLLKVKVRELFLKKKAWELNRQVGKMKKLKEASLHVRELTQEIRKSLDRHTILYTTLLKLSNTLDLQNCAVWMPNEIKTEMNLTHELKGRSSLIHSCPAILINDPDVKEIKESRGVKILRPDSALGIASSGGFGEPGAVAAIRMPMLRVANFKGGTPELIPQCYAILVLVLPNTGGRVWTFHELEIVEVVADQVAVALSHAAVLEESQLMRDKLAEQNRALQQVREKIFLASQARNSFQNVMSHSMRRPMHSILGLLSVIQHENLSSEQHIIVESMLKTSIVLSTLINDVMEISSADNGRFPLEMRSFQLHTMIKEAACLAKCLCVCKGFSFTMEVENPVPDQVMGDERRVFQVILHMVGNILKGCEGGGYVTFHVSKESGSVGRNDQKWEMWRPSSFSDHAYIKFEIGIRNYGSQPEGSASMVQFTGRRHSTERIEEDLSFSMCKKLVQMMKGNIWVVPNTRDFVQSMRLILKFQLQPSIGGGIFEPGGSSEQLPSEFRGLKVILADYDDINRAVTRKLLEKLGCQVAVISSGFECLSALGPSATSFHIILLDLNMPEMDRFEVATRVRKFQSRSWPLIIALTASADHNVWEWCLQVGMNGLIHKPVMLHGIADELRRVLQRASKDWEIELNI